MFETRSQSWREAGLLRQISPRAVRRARFEALLLLPLFIGIVVFNDHRRELLGRSLHELEAPIQVISVILLMILGWVIARSIGRAFGPSLFRRLEPATAGPVGFLIRLLTVAVTFVVALRIAGVNGKTLALGGAFTAVIVGLAAQQTLGNVIAGTMLLSTRPFRVGDRVLLQAGMLGGQVDGVSGRVEGIVSSLGLFYTTFVNDDATILIPNGVVMSVLVILGEDARRFDAGPGESPQQHNGAGSSPAGSAKASISSDAPSREPPLRSEEPGREQEAAATRSSPPASRPDYPPSPKPPPTA